MSKSAAYLWARSLYFLHFCCRCLGSQMCAARAARTASQSTFSFVFMRVSSKWYYSDPWAVRQAYLPSFHGHPFETVVGYEKVSVQVREIHGGGELCGG